MVMDNQDLFSKFDGEASASSLLGGSGGDDDPFNDSGTEFFDKLLADEAANGNNGSKSILLSGGNDSSINAQSLLDGVLNNSAGSIDMDVELDSNTGNQGDALGTSRSAPLSAETTKPEAISDMQQKLPSAFNQQQTTGNAMFLAPANRRMNPTLDAAPLNLSLGDGGITSTLRRKGSSAKLSSTKLNSAIKANVSSSKLKSTKSDGLLARALKARYNSSSNVNKYSVNAAGAAAVINAKIPRNALSAAGMAALRSNSSMYRAGSNVNMSMAAVEEQGSGTQNASWGGPSAKRRIGGASLFSKILSTPGSNMEGGLASRGSSNMLRATLGSRSGSRTSMQDILRMGRTQSKTQTLLRQSSAHSLMKQASSQSLKEIPKRMDVSSLLPPQHTATGVKKGGLSHSFSGNGLAAAQQQVPAPNPAQAGGNFETSSLLHQSCRLYPTTAPVVESALRIDPEAVRRAVPVTLETGQTKKSQNVYGYPVNVAMTHGASMEVLKMLVEAGPDVLVQKDGTDGSGSLGIALSNKCDVAVLNLLVQANPQCVAVADRRGNYPLHVAVNLGFPLEIVKKLYSMYPKALQMKNFHSETPLDIAQRSTRCSEEVMNFLQSTAFTPLESTAHHLDQVSSDLEDGLDDIMETNF